MRVAATVVAERVAVAPEAVAVVVGMEVAATVGPMVVVMVVVAMVAVRPTVRVAAGLEAVVRAVMRASVASAVGVGPFGGGGALLCVTQRVSKPQLSARRVVRCVPACGYASSRGDEARMRPRETCRTALLLSAPPLGARLTLAPQLPQPTTAHTAHSLQRDSLHRGHCAAMHSAFR